MGTTYMYPYGYFEGELLLWISLKGMHSKEEAIGETDKQS